MEATQQAEVAADTASITSQGSIEKAGGDNVTSFDELEAVESYAKTRLKQEAKKEVEKEKAKKEVEKESKPSKEIKSDAKPKEDKKTEEKEEKESAKSKESDEKEAHSTTKAKIIKAKHNEKEIDLDPTTTFKLKVDGEDTDATLQDIINSFSGHKAVEKRFSEFNLQKQAALKQQKQFETERTTINQKLKEITELSKNDPNMAVARAVEILGGNPESFLEQLQTSMVAEFEKWSAMSEEQREVYKARQKAEAYKNQLESMQKRVQAERTNAELESKIKGLQSKYDIDDEAFDTAGEWLMNMYNQGKITQKITPEFVSEFVVSERITKQSEQILDELMPDVQGAQRQLHLETLTNFWRQDPSLKAPAVKSEAMKYWKIKSPEENLARKMEKNNTKPESSRTKDPQKEELFTFDDLN